MINNVSSFATTLNVKVATLEIYNKVVANEDTLLLMMFSRVGKRAGHKTFVLCPCRENGETFVADTKCF